MTPPMTPREKVVFKQPCKHCQRMTTVDLTALASGSGDHAELAKAIDRLLPIGIQNTPDYAEVSFGECQAQAMTMEPETWLALNHLPALLAENAALRAERDRNWDEFIAERQSRMEHGAREAGYLSQVADLTDRATEAERKLAEARDALIQADLTIRSFPGADQSHVEFIRTFLSSKEAERG